MNNDAVINFGEEIEVGAEREFVVIEPQVCEIEITKNPDTSKRTKGSAKMTASPIVSFSLKATTKDGVEAYLTHDLFMNQKCIGFISDFLVAFGCAKRGDRLNPRWNEMVGMKAVAMIGKEVFTRNDQTTGEKNVVSKFYDHESEDSIKWYSGSTAQPSDF